MNRTDILVFTYFYKITNNPKFIEEVPEPLLESDVIRSELRDVKYYEFDMNLLIATEDGFNYIDSIKCKFNIDFQRQVDDSKNIFILALNMLDIETQLCGFTQVLKSINVTMDTLVIHIVTLLSKEIESQRIFLQK